MSLFSTAAKLEEQNRSFAFISITSSEGSVPREKANMILLPDGSTRGTVGGGPAEKLVCEEGLKCLTSGESRTVKYRLDSGNSPESIAMVCGGSMDFFIEVFMPRPSLFLAGGGHVNAAVASLADMLGYPYAVADSRPGFPSQENYPGAMERINAESPAAYIRDAADKDLIRRETALIVATHNHDDAALDAALKTGSFYIGMLGSKRKTALFLEKMRAQGHTEAELARVHAPVGLDLGAETPAEIALSIMAEIMRVRSGASASSLSLNSGTRSGKPPLVLVRGAGDIATGVIIRLHNSGFRVAALEAEQPTVIRRTVALAEAVTAGSAAVEGVKALRCTGAEEIEKAFAAGQIPVIPDPKGQWIEQLKPLCVVDAIIAKRNLGTRKEMAPVVIGLGPGFTAGDDVHAVVETNRGHSLGQLILEGTAMADTGVPGIIADYGKERVIHAPGAGRVEVLRDIGSLVKKGEPLARIGEMDVPSPLDGVVRGMIADGTVVPEGMKMGDVDPRGDASYCLQVSDKARSVGGGVLEAILRLSGLLLGTEH